MNYPEFKSMQFNELELEGLTAGLMPKSEQAKMIGLNQNGIEYDDLENSHWLEQFLSFCKQKGLKIAIGEGIEKPIDYLTVISTSFWVHYEGDHVGRPYSACTEIQEAINNFIGEKGADI